MRIAAASIITALAVLLPAAVAQTLDEELARIGTEVRSRALQPQAVASEPSAPAAPATPAPSVAPAASPAPAPVTVFTPPGGGGNERLPDGLDQAAFEATLARDFAGTFNFYNQLRPAHKTAVYDLYRQDGRVDSLRRETLRLLTQP